MSNKLRIVAGIGLVLGTVFAVAQADEKSDIDQLGQLNEAYVQAFNRHDAAAIGQLFTTGGDYLVLTGDLLAGREQIEQGHAAFFRNNPNAKLEGKLLKRKFLTPDLVLSHGEWSVTGGPAGVTPRGLWIAIQIRDGKAWRYETVRLMIPLKP